MRLQSSTPFFFLAFFFLHFSLFGQLTETIEAHLSGQQEALPVITMASGQVSIEATEVDDDSLRIVVTGSFANLSSPVATDINGGAHIHAGLPGRNGPILLPLTINLDEDSLGGTFEAAQNTIIAAQSLFDDTDVGQVYVNIHTRNYPGGEIRGNLAPADSETYFVNLFGSNEVPSVVSQAYGAVFFDVEDGVLYATGSFRDLSSEVATRIAGGAHLHFGLPGENGPVEIPLAIELDEGNRSGVFVSDDEGYELTDEQLGVLRSGQFYVNLHTENFPGGELRGQVLPVADALFRAHLSGANEWPVVTSSGSGQVLGHLAGNTLTVLGSFDELNSAVNTNIGGGIHLHTGMAGMNGPISYPLSFRSNEDSLSGFLLPAQNEYELTDEQVAGLFDRGVYFNLHTFDHPAGEIRGQMLGESQAVFTAFLNGNQQIPGITTTGRGMVKVEMRGTEMTASGSYTDLTSDLATSIAGGAHIHAGYPGQAGPVIFPLQVNTDDDGSGRSGVFFPMENHFMAGPGGIDTLMRRFFYVNVHSLDHRGGEIRGSLLAEAESYFLAPLSGASQPEGIPTDATGMVAAEVTDTVVTLVGSFNDLDSDFAADVAGGMHLHNALAGTNGDIVVSIITDRDENERSGVVLADSNRFELSPAQLSEMLDRKIYVNVHTADNQSGAIRGQMLPLAGSYFHTTLLGANATNYVVSSAQGGLKGELIDSMLMISGSVRMLDGDFDASINGGAHLHLGTSASNGPISVGLNAEASQDLKAATFSVADNTFMLDSAQLAALRSNGMYANIHTTTVPSGEARGQVVGELNLPPSASMILSPMDMDSLTLEGPADSAFVATYSSSTDPSMDSVMYIWQLATDADFTNVVLSVNTGRDTFFATDFGTVDGLLSEVGVDAGAMATVYHRVLASDGSNFRPGSGSAVVLTRGQLVGTRNYRPEGFAARAFPNPAMASGPITYELRTLESFRGNLQLFTQLGQLQYEQPLNITVGTQRHLLPADLPAGTYFLTLRNTAGQLVDVNRLIVR